MKIHIIVLFFFVSLLSWAMAQSEIKREHYSRQDGLPSNAISDILSDSRGYMWFSTWEGLSRFDGYNFVNYKTGADSRVPYLHNRIARIYEDKIGNIWMIMYDGKLFRLNRRTDKFESMIGRFPNSEKAKVEAPLFASDGDIWAIIKDGGVIQIETDSLSNQTEVRFHALNDTRINQLYEDTFSTIWLATSKGVLALMSDTLSTKRYKENEEALTITQLNGSIYWGTAQGNLWRYEHNSQLLTKREIKRGQKILSLVSSPRESALYIGTQGSGLFRYDPVSESKRQVVSGLRHVNSLYTDSKGLIWMYTDKPGVSMYNPGSRRYMTFQQKVPIPAEYNPSGTIDEYSGTIWVRMKGGGFGYYDRKKNEIDYFHNNPNIPNSLSNVVSVAEISSPDVVWISTYTRGVDKLSIIQRKAVRKQLVEGTSSVLANEIRALYRDRADTLWMATKSGVIYGLDGQMNILHRLSHDDTGNVIGRVYTITQDRNGDFWLGTRGNGLFKMSRGTRGTFHFEHYTHDDADPFSISANDVFDILEDSRGRLWVATFGGGINLIEKSNGKLRFLSERNYFKKRKVILSHHKIRTLLEDKAGRIWAGTTEGLLAIHYDEKTKDIHTVVHRNKENTTTSLSNNDVLCAHKDNRGNLWFGTIGGGLIKYVHESSGGAAQLVSYTVEDGLPSNEIRSITEDRDGHLWFTTENNICSFHPETNLFTTLSVLEGVDNTLFSESAAELTSNGNIVFGTVDGYYLLDKHRLSAGNSTKFRLQITDVHVNGENSSPRLNSSFQDYVPESGLLLLPDRHAVFSLQFASLNYPLQHRIQYQYMLSGYDETWINADQRRSATYANLPAGNYTFKVKAFLPSKPDVYEETSIDIQVPFYFWESRLAYILYGCVLFVLCAGLFGFQYRRITMLRKLRVHKIGPSEIAFRDDDDYKFISGLFEWLESNYSNPDLRIEDMVTFSGLGRTTFYNRLKTLVQMSPVEFLSDFRLKKARMYIEKTNDTIAEIAYRTGFSDPAYFTRLFKSKYNETPSQCRKQVHSVPMKEAKPN